MFYVLLEDCHPSLLETVFFFLSPLEKVRRMGVAWIGQGRLEQALTEWERKLMYKDSSALLRKGAVFLGVSDLCMQVSFIKEISTRRTKFKEAKSRFLFLL